MATILIVEDNPALRYTLSEWLRSEGMEVTEAADADEAVTVLSSILKVDLVITDVQMPGSMDGYGLVQFIGQKYPALPVIVVTCNERQTLPELKIADFFYKPYDFNMLAARIKELLPPAQAQALVKKAGE